MCYFHIIIKYIIERNPERGTERRRESEKGEVDMSFFCFLVLFIRESGEIWYVITESEKNGINV